MTDDIQEFVSNPSFKRERLFVASVISLFAVIGFYNLYEDWVENVSMGHLIVESIVNFLALVTGIYLFTRLAIFRHKSWKDIREEYKAVKRTANNYKMQVAKYREGVTNEIVQQFKLWKLTPAEEEICLLLLKGFSLQEISQLRETSERTIRQQASTLYKKSGLNGRAQLSAYFLEDLLAERSLGSGTF